MALDPQISGSALSICLIVKNEEQFLARSLESVRGLKAEVILCDTGSMDNTKKIANDFGVKIVDYQWQNDFAAARNFAIEQARGKWILMLDGDEALEISDQQKILQLLDGDFHCYYLQRKHYTTDLAAAGLAAMNKESYHWSEPVIGYTQTLDIRLFPRDERLRYGGRLHEMLEPSIKAAECFELRNSGALIHHFGELKSDLQKQAKFDLYLQLGHLKCTDSGGSWQQLFEYGVELSRAGRPQEAIVAFKKALDQQKNFHRLWRELGRAQLMLKDIEESLFSFRKSLELCLADNDAWNLTGLGLMQLGQFNEAKICFRNIIDNNKEEPHAWFNLAEACAQSGENEAARDAYLRTLQIVPNHEPAKNGLRRLPLSPA